MDFILNFEYGSIFCFLIFLIFPFLLYNFPFKSSLKARCEVSNIPHLGNGTLQLLRSFLTGRSLPLHIKLGYDQLVAKCEKQNCPLIGFGLDFGVPTLTIGDPDLLKAVFVKDFHHFENRREFQISKKDILLGKMLSSLKGKEWKLWRNKLSPTFTTLKIKRLFPVFSSSCQKLVNYIQFKLISDGNFQDGNIDVSLAFRKFSLDVIVAASCGIDSKVLAAENQGQSSIFEEMGEKMHIHFDGLQVLKFLAILMAPKLADLLGFSVLSFEGQQFWADLMKRSIAGRAALNAEGASQQTDFVTILLENRSKGAELAEGEEEENLIANCVQLLLGGLDTVASALVFALYALATNPDVQDQLREEVVGVKRTEHSADDVAGMEYLDMFINETLRFYPPAVDTDRVCTEDYLIPGTSFILKKGELVSIPIYGIHHDQKNFENPNIFNPLRFQMKDNINPYSFLPFGLGPRACIAMRFALLEIKAAVVAMVANFKIEPSTETDIPIQFGNGNALKPKKPMILRFTKLI